MRESVSHMRRINRCMSWNNSKEIKMASEL